MSQVLGIDIGSYTIKFVVLELEKSTVTLKDAIEIPIPSRENDDDVKLAKIQVMRQALTQVDLSKIRDNIYTGLGSQHAVLQNFEFLRVSRKNLGKVIENEFEDLGLFSLNQYIIDHIILKRTSKVTNALGLLIQKSEAMNLIDILGALQLKCRTIDLNCLSFQNILPYINHHLEVSEKAHSGAVLIINSGHTKTSVTIIENEKVILERSFNMAGHYITTEIQSSCQTSYAEAEELKHNFCDNIESKTNDDPKVEKALKQSCKEIIKEIERIILAFTQSEEAKHIGSIFLTGGATKFKQFSEMMENELGIKTSQLNFSHESFNNESEVEYIYETFSQAIALALRATGAKTNSSMNIRHGDLALMSDYENLIEKILTYIKYAAVILVCFGGTYALRAHLYDSKINQIKTLFSTQVSSYFGSEPLELRAISSKANWDFAQYNTTAWNLINRNFTEKTNFINTLLSTDSMIPIVILNEISAVIPKSIYFEISNYKFQDGVLSIQADSNSKESVEEIIKNISTIKILSNVQKKSESSKEGTAGALITFSILATLNSNESI